MCLSGKWACLASILVLCLATGKSSRAVLECYEWDSSHFGRCPDIAPLSAIVSFFEELKCGFRCNLAGSLPKRPS